MGSRVILFTFGVFGCVEQSDSGEKVHTELDQFKLMDSITESKECTKYWVGLSAPIVYIIYWKVSIDPIHRYLEKLLKSACPYLLANISSTYR
jgi:hypothetical protein